MVRVVQLHIAIEAGTAGGSVWGLHVHSDSLTTLKHNLGTAKDNKLD